MFIRNWNFHNSAFSCSQQCELNAAEFDFSWNLDSSEHFLGESKSLCSRCITKTDEVWYGNGR